VVLPYGFTNAVVVLLMPYLLRKNGMTVGQIATVTAVAYIPLIWSFLWSPLADTGLRRRSWAIVSAVTSAITAAAAILFVHSSVPVLMTLLFVSNGCSGLLSASCGALLTMMPESMRGRASGWYQAGNVGGNAVAGGGLIWLADHVSLQVIAMIVLVVLILPSFAALWLQEAEPIRSAIGPKILGMLRDLLDLLRSRRTWLGLTFFLSPVGTAAVNNLISGVGQDYHASGNEVALVTGVASGLLSTVGCFAGGLLADKMNRMMAYALSGGLTAVFGAWLAFGPLSPFTFAAGYSGYSLAAGFAYAVYTALLLDVVGKQRHAAALAYSALNASGNASIAYMTWLDGKGSDHWGVRGMMGTDMAANAVFAVVLVLVAVFAGHHWHHKRETA
jgi:MFS family permease